MWTAAAVVLYLLPIAGFCVARAKLGRDALAVALDVPLAVACDFLLVLVASRFVVLDYAVFVARGLEAIGLTWMIFQRRDDVRSALAALRLPTLVGPVLGAALALYLSSRISMPYAIWDRHWHIPLVTSLRGQNAPFHNVYEPGRHIFYHYAGDALAAVFQALSFAHMHASAALSRAHDVLYALTGLFLGAALRTFGTKSSALCLLVIACVLAGGPATVLFEGTQRWGTGWSTINLLSLSFRPHEPLSFLFALTTMVAGLGPFLRVGFQPRRDALAPLASAVAVLALSDEPTLAMVVGTVGVAWLVAPRELAGSWRDRLLMVASPFVATLLTLLVLGGTFSIGAPKQAIELVPARVPGFYMASLPLGGQPALASLACDYLGPFGVMLSGVLSAFGRRSARGWVLLAAHAALFLASLAILLVVRVNHDDMESHRAVTGLMLLAPVFWLSWVARLPAGALRDSVIGVGGLACLVGVVSTAEWVRGVIKVDAPRLHSFWGDDWFYTTDCVAATGAKLGERAEVSIGPKTSWYRFAGCRPLFAPPGGPPGGHAIVVGWPDAGASAFSTVAGWAPTPQQVRLFYPTALAHKDGVADDIRVSATNCRPAGREFVECRLGAREFLAFVDRRAESNANVSPSGRKRKK